MANNLGTNPMYIDTVMATPYTANLRISNIIWSDQANAGDALTIVDRNGNLLLNTKAQAANYQQALGGLGWVQGFKVSVLASGNITIVVSKA